MEYGQLKDCFMNLFDMHVIKKISTENVDTHIEIQNNFQNRFYFFKLDILQRSTPNKWLKINLLNLQ